MLNANLISYPTFLKVRFQFSSILESVQKLSNMIFLLFRHNIKRMIYSATLQNTQPEILIQIYCKHVLYRFLISVTKYNFYCKSNKTAQKSWQQRGMFYFINKKKSKYSSENVIRIFELYIQINLLSCINININVVALIYIRGIH